MYRPGSKRPSRLAAALALTLALPALAFAAELSTDPAALPKASYRLDPHHTSVTMRISHMGFSHYTLRFDKVSGMLDYDPQDRTHPGLTVEIDPRSIDSGDGPLDRQIAGPDFFDAARYPKITFVAKELVEAGEGRGQLTGDLTFHGVTKPVTLSVAFNGWGGDVIGRTTMGFSATGEISRTDFGVTKYKNWVGDTVRLDIESEFQKDGILTRLLP